MLAALEIPPQTVHAWFRAIGIVRSPTAAGMHIIRLPDEPPPVAAARRAACVVALAMTPGTVVLDSDPRPRTVTVHRLGNRPGVLESAVTR